MSNKVIIDTSIWVNFFRGTDSKTVKEVSRLVREERAVLAGLVITELIQGIKKKADEKIVKKTMAALPYYEATREVWEKTGKKIKELRLKGVNLPLSDVLLATIAEENNCSVFTLDNHFRQIDGVSLFKS